jgi:hypothetical protein
MPSQGIKQRSYHDEVKLSNTKTPKTANAHHHYRYHACAMHRLHNTHLLKRNSTPMIELLGDGSGFYGSN